MDNVMWVVSKRTFWSWKPIYVFNTREAAEDEAEGLEATYGGAFKVDRVELR